MELAIELKDIYILNGVKYEIPIDNKIRTDFVFKEVGTGDIITFTNWWNRGNGNYVLSGWSKSTDVYFWLGGIWQLWFGAQPVADALNLSGLRDVSISGIANGHLLIYNSVSGKWENRVLLYSDMPAHVVFDNQNLLSMGGSQQQFAHPFRIAPLPDDPEFDNSLVWKSWVVDNFVSTTGDLGRYIMLQQNRILVDSKLPSDIAGVHYRNISDAVSWIHLNGNPTTSNRWTIYIMPNEGGYYEDNWLWYDFINIIGLGRVKIRNMASYIAFTRSGLMADKNVRCENLDFVNLETNLTLKKMLIVNCTFSGTDGESAANLHIDTCQLDNVGLYVQTGAVISDANNRIISAFGNYNIAFSDVSDVVYLYNYKLSDIYQS